ncbi:MAG: protease pro-enzyme activation domain-containing protein [Alicyclobacillaceae bacterium]|jgi:kumamolisin|nr:protease pro-enzyme activation domain-containing protein [Alicyclobacillaceae bacterium]
MKSRQAKRVLSTAVSVATLCMMSSPVTAMAATNNVSIATALSALPSTAVLLGATSPTQKMVVSLVLKPQAGLTSAANQMMNTPIENRPKLTPTEFASMYGNPQASSIADYFSSAGLQAQVQPGNLMVNLTGTASQIEKVFGIQFDNVSATLPEFGLQKFYRATGTPTLPASIASQVQLVVGLSNQPTLKPMLTRATGKGVGDSATQYPDEGGTPLDYLPADIHAAYDVNSVYQDGYLGQGETIGIMTLANFNPANTETFWQDTDLPATPTLHLFDVDWAGNNPNTSGQTESTLDSSESGAMAPGATIDEYIGYTAGYASMLQTFQEIVSNDTADVISSSWGAPEDEVPTDYMNALNDVFKQAVMQGQTILQASGDTGAYSDPNSSAPVALFPATSPYVTAAGGTTLVLADDSRVSETAWSYLPVAGSDTGGSGGGYSSFFKEPSWQLNAGIPDAPRMRGVPDVALNANPETGYQIYDDGEWENGYGGTSFAAPQWAGFTALMDQALGKRLGNMNEMVYSLALTPAYANSFYDITEGTNGAYSAGTGWSAVTGWGTPDVSGLIAAIQGPTPIYESINSAASSVTTGQSTTVTVTITDARGQGVAGQPISLTSDSTTADISNGGYGTTNAEGQATFTVSDSSAQAVEFTGTDENSYGNVDPQNVTVDFVQNSSGPAPAAGGPAPAPATP